MVQCANQRLFSFVRELGLCHMVLPVITTQGHGENNFLSATSEIIKKKRVSGLWRNKSTSFFFFLDSNTTLDFTNEQTEFLNHSLQCMVCILAASMTGLMSV